jgi:hypothetical protein
MTDARDSSTALDANRSIAAIFHGVQVIGSRARLLRQRVWLPLILMEVPSLAAVGDINRTPSQPSLPRIECHF